MLSGVGRLLWGSRHAESTPSRPRTPEESLDLQDRLMGHVRTLAEEIGERHIERPEAYRRAADHIRAAWEAQGYSVREERYRVHKGDVANLMVEIPGTSRPDEIVVIGAHYDTNAGTPGADDNATGVAALLEVSRALAGSRPARTLRLVAFANEEEPFFATEQMGSGVHARRARKRGEKIVGMVALEMLGCYSDQPGSQHYLPGFEWILKKIYPNRGDFLMVAGNLPSWRLAARVKKHLREANRFPTRRFLAPASLVEEIGLSDQRSFWQEGYRAVMITDTAFFRNPHYHQPTDTPATLDAPRFARAVEAISHMARRLAES